MKTSTANAVVLLLLIALLFGALWPAFQSPGPPEDEGIALVYPEMFMKGRLPYRDFETIYGPGNLLVLSGAYRLCGDNIFVERTVGLIYRLLILVGMVLIARRSGVIAAFASGLAATIILAGTDLFANTWFAATAFALMSMLLASKRESHWRCATAGMLFALALLCRCDLGPLAIISFLPLILAMQRKSLVAFLAGAGVGFSPLVWFAAVMGLGQLVHALFIFPVFELSSSAYLPLSSAALELRLIFYLSIFASVINLIAGFVTLRDRKLDGRRLLLAAAIFGAGSIYYALSRFDGSHVINATLLSIALLPPSLQILISKKLEVRYAALAATLIVLAVVHAAYFPSSRYFYRNLRVTIHLDQPKEAKWGEPLEPGGKGFFIRSGGRFFPLGRTAVANFAQRLVTELGRLSRPGQKLLVGPGDFRRTVGADTFFYHLFPALEPATYYLEMNPGSTNAPGSRLASDVAGADWLILDRSWDYINEPNRSSEFGSDVPNQIVREKFDFWAEYGPYLLMRSQRLRTLLELPPSQH